MRAILTLAASVAGLAVNDLCQGALPVTSTNVSGTVAGTLGDSSMSGYYHDVFYTYNASCSGKARATLLTASSNLRFSTYWGSTCASLHNEAKAASVSANVATPIEWQVNSGDTYYIAVATRVKEDTASFTLNVGCTAAVLPSGDFCSTARTLMEGNTAISSIDATASGFKLGFGATKNEIWYKYNASCTGEASFTFLDTSDVDVVFASFEFGDSCDMVGRSTYDNYTDETPQQITVPATQNHVSYVTLATYSTSGRIDADAIVTLCTPLQRPVNDRCFEAASYVIGTNITGSTVNATKTPTKCNNQGLWYRTTATCTGDLEFTTTSAYVSFYDAASTCIDLASLNGCTSSSSPSFAVQNGSTYYFLVYGSNANFELSTTCTPIQGGSPSNDWCSGAIALTGEVSANYSNVNATNQVNYRRCPVSNVQKPTGEPNNDVWFRLTPSCTGTVTISVQSSDFTFAQLYVYGGNCSSQQLLSCSEAASSSVSAVAVIPSVSGVSFNFAVASYYSYGQGNFLLTANCVAITSAPTAPTTLAPTTLAPTTLAPTTPSPTAAGQTSAPTTRRPTAVNETYEPMPSNQISGATQILPALALFCCSVSLSAMIY